MTIYDVKTIDGNDAQLWSDYPMTLHFGAGFANQRESTCDDLAAEVSEESLWDIVDDAEDGNDRDKANAAITGGSW